MLRRKSIPLNDDDLYLELLPAGSTHMCVTEQAVERALSSQLIMRAPGPDELSFRSIRLLWKWDRARIVRLKMVAICRGRHSGVWKQASRVVIRKPGKDDYMKLKAYHSICLLSGKVKVFKNVFAELLSGEAKRRGLLSDRQFGSKIGPLAIDAPTITVDRAHAAQTNGH